MQSASGSTVPAARILDLITNDVHGEVLVYDQQCPHIHHLNAVVAAVWRLCDAERTVRDLGQAAAIDERAVRLALHKLEKVTLLDGPLSTEMRGTQSRRAFMGKAAVVGAIALPAIVSITAPEAAAAQSAPFCATVTCKPMGIPGRQDSRPVRTDAASGHTLEDPKHNQHDAH